MTNSTYTTLGGENWGQISNLAFGNAFRIKELTDYNPAIPLYQIFPAGVVINIPLPETNQEKYNSPISQPPWRQ